MHVCQRWPVARLIGRQTPIDRIDAKRKELIKLRVERTEAGNVRSQEIPIKCFQVTDIEDNAVPLRDGALIKRGGSDDIEQGVGLASSLGQARQQTENLHVSMGSEHTFVPGVPSVLDEFMPLSAS